jgi:carbamoyl-phosphate synthase small subunit
VALELKNQLTGQDYRCAINQFMRDRSSKEFAFRLNHRFLVYFAVDLYEAWMTTQLADGNTRFLPFNQGSNGAGVTGGAGNPADNVAEIAVLAEIAGKYPLFAVGLGCQMFAVARGARTEKLHHGHRGANHPVRDLAAGRTYITAQNHGYAVTTPPHNAKQTYTNVNDKTCEGIEYNNIPVYSLEFAPETASGPVDTKYMFDKFIEAVDCYKK